LEKEKRAKLREGGERFPADDQANHRPRRKLDDQQDKGLEGEKLSTLGRSPWRDLVMVGHRGSDAGTWLNLNREISHGSKNRIRPPRGRIKRSDYYGSEMSNGEEKGGKSVTKIANPGLPS